MELVLAVRDFTGPDRWRWELTGPDGRLLAGHEVRLDRDGALYEAFVDLPGYVRRHAPPDERVAREREIVRELGAWIGARVLGPVADALLAAAPAVVRVVAPPAARGLLHVPLELAHAGGGPLAVRDVTLVVQVDGDAPPPAREPGRPVRVLALFSLPEGSRALNLRRERVALTRLFADSGRAVELHTLQYGVTRERLAALLARPEGWDVLHLSAHGTPGELLLEDDTGRPDRVDAADLAELLGAARGVSLVTLSACWSGAVAVRERRRRLGVPTGAEGDGEAAGRTEGDGEAAGRTEGDGEAAAGRTEVVGALAGELAGRLGCAVLAMRYPVADDFAIALAERVYRALVLEGRTLPEALRGAVRGVWGADGGPALEAVTPALFGGLAAGLRLDAAAGAGASDTAAGAEGSDAAAEAEAAGQGAMPPPAERFVGRVALLARASAVLAPGGGACGVLLLGMPGVGKTACVRELVETHGHSFDGVVWCAVPRWSGTDAQGALAELAVALEGVAPGSAWVRMLDGDFGAFVAALAGCLARRRLLVVVDDVDALLDGDDRGDGGWRDGRWGTLLAALSAHGGPGRVVLTGRVRPPGLGAAVPTVPVELLTPDEAVLLARELPHLARLAEGRLPGVAPAAARRYVTGLLDATRGHPGLLELADAQAADPARLAALLGSAGRADGRADGFLGGGQGTATGFRSGGPGGADADERLRVLAAWTDAIADALPPVQRDLFHFLCCLEEPDRTRAAVDHNWPAVRAQLGHAADAPAVGLDALVDRGLLTQRTGPTPGHPSSYDIQSAVAARGRARAGEAFRELVDTRMSGYWVRVFELAWRREGTAAEGARLAGPLLARAGLSAAPYLIRARLWQGAEALLQAVLRRDDSRPTRARVLPVLRRLAALAATGAGAPPTGALSEVLWVTDPATAERQARAALAAARAAGDHRAAAGAAGTLAGLCLRTGRLDEALAMADAEIEHARVAGLGPWTRLLGEVHRLHVRLERGDSGRVLEEAADLLERTRATPREWVPGEGVLWWEVWEELCDTAQRAAVSAGAWARAVEYNAELCAAKAGRGAAGPDFAQARFPVYLALLRLGRAEEALAVLEECREVFEAAGDDLHLGEVFGALATVEDARGRGTAALARGRDCLRYAYRAGVPATIAVSHANFGTYLHSHAGDASGAAAHHLAGALLGALTGGRTVDALGGVVADLREFGAAAELPGTPRELCARVAAVPGVALDRLLERLAPGQDRLAALLAELTRTARAEADTGSRGGALAAAAWGIVWEPALAALVSAARGNTAARVKLRQHLDRYEAMAPAFTPLAGVVRRLLDGERDAGVAAGLGPLDAPVAARALAALRGEVEVPVALWPALHLSLALGNLVGAAAGDPGTAEATRGTLAALGADRGFAPLAPVLAGILDGDRDPRLVERLREPVQRAVVTAVLHYLAGIGGRVG
ncbi:CHAT domain-containing protein [Streptomyces flavalbus]|uniref:CHAT domain-containing protein n=1 Tax=Streptomyces flavalbus TaxID=2665155 RepID=A0ABW2WBD1_9ACTN